MMQLQYCGTGCENTALRLISVEDFAFLLYHLAIDNETRLTVFFYKGPMHKVLYEFYLLLIGRDNRFLNCPTNTVLRVQLKGIIPVTK